MAFMQHVRAFGRGYGMGSAALLGAPLGAYRAFVEAYNNPPAAQAAQADAQAAQAQAQAQAAQSSGPGFFARFGAGLRAFGRAGFVSPIAGIREAGSWPGYVGYGLALGTPLLAGAAVYSGLANLRRGRYGASLAYLALGASLVGGMFAARHYLASMPVNPSVNPDAPTT